MISNCYLSKYLLRCEKDERNLSLSLSAVGKTQKSNTPSLFFVFSDTVPALDNPFPVPLQCPQQKRLLEDPEELCPGRDLGHLQPGAAGPGHGAEARG